MIINLDRHHTQCPMPNAQCPMPNAPCPMPNAPSKNIDKSLITLQG
ncbi:hypothetical protein H6G98_25470 [Nostoc sp. FACHB-857]|nr:hypothetical protein [Nostoc sp. FACHB-857]